jgi:UDP-glucose 4-epimerase
LTRSDGAPGLQKGAELATRNMRRAVVFGGCGFLGQWLIRSLTARGVEVTSVDRDPRGRLDGMGVSSLQIPARDAEFELADLMADQSFDVAFSLIGTGLVPRSIAAPLEDLANNVGSLLGLLEVIRRLDTPPLVVNLSSAAVYGTAQTTPMTEDHPRHPESPYGVSKAAAEDYLRLYHDLYGIRALSVRPFSIYGPGQRKLVVHDLLKRLLAGENPLVVNAMPLLTRDFVFVEDAAEMITRLAERAPAEAEAYNICSGRGTSLEELVGSLIALVAPEVPIAFSGKTRAGDPAHWIGSYERIAAVTGVEPTALREGLARTAAWMKAEAERAGGRSAN